ncbi:Biotin--[acetyl-CoA-carboxylase] ligase [Rhodovastum atsumiense]|uniref:Biotin--[acetyl-CoA-carboxylase] ligase n=1 Tax=Rhodovastum atsumiense TaxID=504468 RepID=A0A5M6J3Y1_9PROT|nr:biotin--[acetyl-CoA-carboxylase] ligase [Rhodovastum atsumiense]KAA5614365.1 biotin--[acetyl-CoA-carboxylase] ligase [Rhodovastum atsumiense]CAH2604839.1 Biotin--[acetyl-CoA-carboxylase] ligase [Rhodovastum atsumiense]
MTVPAGWRLEVHDQLPSTADLCRRRAESGAPGGLAILARRQTAGRGTRLRPWQGAEGNLFLSVLLRPGGTMQGAAQWSLLAGVALAEALAAHLPEGAALGLKWPNDVLLSGRKLAGILTESASGPEGNLAWLSLGLGVNLAVAPALTDRPTACLAELAPPPAPEAFAATLLAAIDRWCSIRAGEGEAGGFAAVRAAFLARTVAYGTHLALRLGDRILDGTFAGLGEDGTLKLHTREGVRAFAAGEVTMGNGA